jgi:hypothetical protein
MISRAWRTTRPRPALIRDSAVWLDATLESHQIEGTSVTVVSYEAFFDTVSV